MATATEETVIKQTEDFMIILVRSHQRALPGEGGSDYKPVNVREHLRQIWSDGKKNRMNMGFKWSPGEMCSELLEAMTEVQGLRVYLPKDHLWTLDEAKAILHHRVYPVEYKGKVARWEPIDQRAVPVGYYRTLPELLNAMERARK